MITMPIWYLVASIVFVAVVVWLVAYAQGKYAGQHAEQMRTIREMAETMKQERESKI